MSEDKYKIIRGVYYDADDEFGSINDTYKQSHRLLNTITLNDVNYLLDRQKSRQTNAYRGFNSYVAKEPLQDIQVDIADFTRSAEVNDGYRYAFVAVDIFTKICHAVPIKDKKPAKSIRAVNEVLYNIGVMNTLYHDNEGSWSSTYFIRLINSNNIKLIITSTPPTFAERMVQTIKNMMHQRLEGLEISKDKWVYILQCVLKKYNDTSHSTTGMKPNEAVKSSNHVGVWFNINSKATDNREYKPIKVGDKVRSYVKPTSMKKGNGSVWSKEILEVTCIKYNNI